ncbi:hypothetical protein BGW39_010773, partial [Mortierella sp. 14UC]
MATDKNRPVRTYVNSTTAAKKGKKRKIAQENTTLSEQQQHAHMEEENTRMDMDTSPPPSNNPDMNHIIAERRENYKLHITPMLSSPSTYSDLDFVLLDRKMTIIYLPTIPQALAAAEYLDSIAAPTSRHKGNIISYNHFELYPDLDENAEQIL